MEEEKIKIVSPDWFILNDGSGEVSSADLDLFVNTPSVPPMARQKYTTYTTGTDEDGTVPDDNYEDIKYSLRFCTFDRENFDNTDIYQFFAKAKKLRISRLPEFEFHIKQVELEQPESLYNGRKIRYTANFTLAPFKYYAFQEEISVTNGSVVTNKGTRYCKPVFRFDMQEIGEITLRVNGQEFTVKITDEYFADGHFTVDTSRYIAYNSDGKILFNSTKGQFPFLNVGENYVEWEGGVGELKILKNERCY